MHCKELHVIAKDKFYENNQIYFFDQANQCFVQFLKCNKLPCKFHLKSILLFANVPQFFPDIFK